MYVFKHLAKKASKQQQNQPPHTLKEQTSNQVNFGLQNTLGIWTESPYHMQKVALYRQTYTTLRRKHWTQRLLIQQVRPVLIGSKKFQC